MKINDGPQLRTLHYITSTLSYTLYYTTSLVSVERIESVDEADKLFDEMVNMFKSGDFTLSKWISNSKDFFKRIPHAMRSSHVVNFDEDTLTKIVGLQWSPVEDVFLFITNSVHSKCTKSSLLSATARLIDPLGLASPVTAYIKLLIQHC